MRYYIDYSLTNGLGHPSVSIYLTGCDKNIKCKGCHNNHIQQESEELCDMDKLLQDLDFNIKQYYNFHNKLYVSILGGEPLAEYNRELTLKISKYIKDNHNDSKLILYSWREFNTIKQECLEKYINYFDYGILGEFKGDLLAPNTIPSSSNQYIYDFKNDKKINPIKLKGAK